MWRLIRPDAYTVWGDREVRERLRWYYQVMRDEMPANFMIAKKIPLQEDVRGMPLEDLWKIHEELSSKFQDLKREVLKRGWEAIDDLEDPKLNFLDLKVEIANNMLHSCTFCERRCKANRVEGEVGTCRLKTEAYVSSWFHHYGEEAPLVPSGTIFYGSCNFRCVFCIDGEDYLLCRVNGKVIVGKVKEAAKLHSEGRRVEVLTLKGWRRVAEVICRRASLLFDIITSKGRRVRVTPEHIVIVWRDSRLEGVRAENLRVGDSLVTLPYNMNTLREMVKNNTSKSSLEVLEKSVLLGGNNSYLRVVGSDISSLEKLLATCDGGAIDGRVLETRSESEAYRLAYLLGLSGLDFTFEKKECGGDKNVYTIRVGEFKNRERLGLDKIVELRIVRGDFKVYDIILEGDGSFLEEHVFYAGNGVLIHNCQNHDISQERPFQGLAVDGVKLALIMKELRREGVRNINHVGGDPTPNLHVILDGIRRLDINVPQLWNSNMYCSIETMRLLREVIDIWLPDMKYGNNKCALKYSAAPKYWEVVTRNLKLAHEWGDIIVRHLVMPNHVECCTKPVLRWIAENLPRSLVNIMEQYRPEHLVLRYPERWPEIARRPSPKELEEAYSYASNLGIVWEPVS